MTNAQIPMTNEEPQVGPTNPTGKYDLSERTARLGERVIGFARGIKLDAVTAPLVRQLVRSATSIGPNYCEADEAGSRKEFRYRISVCNRETKETKYWLRMLSAAATAKREEARELWREAHELNRIFSAIYHRSNAEHQPSD